MLLSVEIFNNMNLQGRNVQLWLRDAALRMKERIKVGPGGVTQDIVENIHRKWRVDEVVKMRFEGPPSLNMKRTHDLLEVPNFMVHSYLCAIFSIQ